MTVVQKRYPTFNIELITEDTEYKLTYDTKKQLRQQDFEQALISFSVKNAMADDSPVFSLVILAKEKWDKLLGANDLVRIKVIPDVTKGEPDNPYIMVGLISEVKKEGEYSEGTLLYRITGRAMSKALIKFEVGVIQEVAAVIPDIGWLPDGTSDGLSFSANTAAGIGNELMERFVYQYIKYNFSNGKTLPDYLVHTFSSWEEDESLADPTPYVNYQGSLRQFLEDVAAKPFNEFFFEYTNDGRCVAIMRPTPFDKEDWTKLPLYRFTSDIVVEESFGKSDNEMYSIFVVQAPNVTEFSAMDLGVYPKFHPSLVEKYGYSRLDVPNRYLLSQIPESAEESAPAVVGPSDTVSPDFADVLYFVTKNELLNKEKLRTERTTVYSELATGFPTLPKSVIDGVIDLMSESEFNRERYESLLATATEGTGADGNVEKSPAAAKLEKFTQKLFNWYCENGNFYGGDIRVIGNPMFRIGSRLLYEDAEQETTWEFYLESTQHEFSFTNGYTTILGVTRGLPENGESRFSNLWGKSEDFKGGYLGEKSLDELVASAENAGDNPANNGAGTSWGASTGAGIAMDALATAREMANRSSVYVFGGGRQQNSPFYNSPVRVDCSSFVWWCYYTHGVSLKGGKTGMTTDTIKIDPKLTTISSRGSSKAAAKSKLQQGDIVYFDTYKADGHIGIYSGNGKFVGAQSEPSGIAEADMSSGYWWDKFNGRVLRYSGN